MCLLAVVFSGLNVLISVFIEMFVFIYSLSKSCAAAEKVRAWGFYLWEGGDMRTKPSVVTSSGSFSYNPSSFMGRC